MKPLLEAPRVLLRPVRQSDIEMLRLIELSPDLLWRWRHRGRTPDPAEYAATRHNSVLCEFLVVDKRTDMVEGFVVCYQPDAGNGHAYVAAAKFNPDDRGLSFIEGTVLFLDHLFRTFPLRKLYFEVPGYNLDQIGSGVGRMFVEEGRLRDHVYLDGKYWDQVVLALYADTWSEKGAPFVRLVSAAGGDL